MAPKKEVTSQDLYVAEKLGKISGELEGIKKDLEELKCAVIPLKRRVYMAAGGIATVGFLASIAGTLIMVINLIGK